MHRVQRHCLVYLCDHSMYRCCDDDDGRPPLPPWVSIPGPYCISEKLAAALSVACAAAAMAAELLDKISGPAAPVPIIMGHRWFDL